MAWELTFDQMLYKLPSSFWQQAETLTFGEEGGREERECGGTDVKEERAGRQEHTGHHVHSGNILLTAILQFHGDDIWQE